MKRQAIGFIWSDTTHAEALPGAKGSASDASEHAMAQAEAISRYAEEAGYELLKLMGKKQNRSAGSMLNDIEMIDEVIRECQRRRATLIYCNVMKFRPNRIVFEKIFRYQNEQVAGAVVCFNNDYRRTAVIKIEERSERRETGMEVLSGLRSLSAAIKVWEALERTRKARSRSPSRNEKISRTIKRKNKAKRRRFSGELERLVRLGLSNGEIASRLNAANIPSVRGRKWSRETVRLERNTLTSTVK